MVGQRPGSSGRPPPSRHWRLANGLGHGLGVVGVIMSAGAFLTGIDPGHWLRLFPWDATSVGQMAAGLIGPGMVVMAQMLVSAGSSRGRRRGPGD